MEKDVTMVLEMKGVSERSDHDDEWKAGLGAKTCRAEAPEALGELQLYRLRLNTISSSLPTYS